MMVHFVLTISLLYTAYFVSLIPEAMSQCAGGTTDFTVETGKVLHYQLPSDGSPNYATVVPDPLGQEVLIRIRTTIGVGDFLTVYEGTGLGGTLVTQKTDKMLNTDEKLISSGNIFVRFTSDNNLDTVKDKVFSIDFVTGTSTGCTTTVPPATTTPQLLTSPNFPGKYEKSKTCTWTLTTTDANEKVQVKLIFMDVESHATCNFDSLEVIDLSGVVSKLCGTQWSPTFTYTSVSSTLDIRLTSDSFTPENGFVIEYVQTTTATTTTTTTITTTTTANPAPSASGGVNFSDLLNFFLITFVSAQLIAFVLNV